MKTTLIIVGSLFIGAGLATLLIEHILHQMGGYGGTERKARSLVIAFTLLGVAILIEGTNG